MGLAVETNIERLLRPFNKMRCLMCEGYSVFRGSIKIG